MSRQSDDCPPAHDMTTTAPRYTSTRFAAVDTRAGWAELLITLDGQEYVWAFSLVIGDPLDEIQRFEADLALTGEASMELLSEPGRTIIRATPSDHKGWVLVTVVTRWPGEKPRPALNALCKTDQILDTMRDNMGFLNHHPTPERRH